MALALVFCEYVDQLSGNMLGSFRIYLRGQYEGMRVKEIVEVEQITLARVIYNRQLAKADFDRFIEKDRGRLPPA